MPTQWKNSEEVTEENLVHDAPVHHEPLGREVTAHETTRHEDGYHAPEYDSIRRHETPLEHAVYSGEHDNYRRHGDYDSYGYGRHGEHGLHRDSYYREEYLHEPRRYDESLYNEHSYSGLGRRFDDDHRGIYGAHMSPAEREHEYADSYYSHAGGNKYGDHRPIDLLHEKRPGLERAMRDQEFGHNYERSDLTHHYRDRGYYLEAEDEDLNFLPPSLIAQGPGAAD